MTIKTIRHKYNSIGDLLYYMVGGMQDPENDLQIAHNLPSFDIEEMKHEFLKNDLYRQETKAQVRWYHELLCFSPLDREQLDTQKLSTITQEYIQRRNPNALCFAVAHMSEAHLHVHLCFSGSEYRSKKLLRMDDKTFSSLRIGMEKYQVQQFPELEHSIVYLDKEQVKDRAKTRDKNRRKENEYQARRRLKKQPTEKEQLQTAVQDAYNKSESIAQFYSLLKTAGLSLYERRGRAAGVVGKRKYRFANLGITKEMLLSLDRLAQKQQEIRRLTRMRRDDFELER